MTNRFDSRRIDTDQARFDVWEAELASANVPPFDDDPGPHGGGGGDDEGGDVPHRGSRIDLVIVSVLAVVCLGAMLVCGISIGAVWF